MLSLKQQHSPTHQQQEAEVSTYFIAELEVTNPAGYEPYRAAVPATIAQYGGRYLTRGAAAELARADRSRNASSSSNSPTPQR
jgi:hypothetical protein